MLAKTQNMRPYSLFLHFFTHQATRSVRFPGKKISETRKKRCSTAFNHTIVLTCTRVRAYPEPPKAFAKTGFSNAGSKGYRLPAVGKCARC